VTPAVFIAWGIIALALQSATSPILIVDWVFAAVIGAAIAWTTTRFDGVRVYRVRPLDPESADFFPQNTPWRSP